MAPARWPELTSLIELISMSESDRLDLATRLAAALGDCTPHAVLVGSAQMPAVHHSATGLLFVAVPGGRFTMGLRDDELEDLRRTVFGHDRKHRFNKELRRWMAPQSTVTREVLVHPFLCATSFAFPDGRAKLDDDGEEDPRLDDQSALELVATLRGHGLRLLSEAEWEWVAREGGTRSWIVDVAGKHGFGLDDGNEPPTAWGIGRLKSHHGEVVADGWHRTYEGAPSDSIAWEADAAGLPGVHRGSGGCWQDEAQAFGCHASFRSAGAKGAGRPARDLP